jgi:hypothetical protein
MTRTMWIALFCLVGLAPAIAIRVVTLPTSPAVEAARDQTGTTLAPVPNEAAKADRLPLHDTYAGTEIAEAEQPETPPAGRDDAVRIPGRRWQDANARALPGETLPRTGPEIDPGDENTSNHDAEPSSRFNRNTRASRVAPPERPQRPPIARRPIVESAGNSPARPREVWHCRQDAMGSILRSLDLSPRCHM